jgi:large subunit ribosomal protein L3
MAIEGIIGKKVGMTQVFADDGALVPVTVIQAGPCLVVQKKTAEKDGYDAVQVGLVEKISNRRITSAARGHFEKAERIARERKGDGQEGSVNVPPMRTLVEFPYEGDANVGDRVQVDIFKAGDSIDVVGQSKGKGFQGVMKRHHFAGGRATHGSMFHRAPGSIGASAFPSRVMKGMRMGGRMGGDQVTVKNLRVAKVDAENNLLYIRGAVPGGRNGLVVVRFSRNGKRGE